MKVIHGSTYNSSRSLQKSSQEEFLKDFKDRNGFKRLILFTGLTGTGKTTNLKDAVGELFNNDLISSYALMPSTDRWMRRFYHADGSKEYRNEYVFPRNRIRHGIHAIEQDAVIVDAHTFADIIIIPEISTVSEHLLLDIALKTGKPVFAEIHGDSAVNSINRLISYDKKLMQEYDDEELRPKFINFLESRAQHDPSFSIETVNGTCKRLPLDIDNIKSVATAAIAIYDHVTQWEKVV